jgi:hypothetical protein
MPISIPSNIQPRNAASKVRPGREREGAWKNAGRTSMIAARKYRSANPRGMDFVIRHLPSAIYPAPDGFPR